MLLFLAKPPRALRFRQGTYQERNILCEPFADLAAWRERDILPRALFIFSQSRQGFRQGIHQEQNILYGSFADFAAWREKYLPREHCLFSRKAAKGAKIPPRDLSRTEYSLRILCGLCGLARERYPPASIVPFLAKPPRALRFRQGTYQERNILCGSFADFAAWREQYLPCEHCFFSRKAERDAKITPRDLSGTEYSLQSLCELCGLVRIIPRPLSSNRQCCAGHPRS